MSSGNREVLLEIKSLKKYFPAERALFARAKHFVHAVDDVSFELIEGESLGLVGESGCGKTTTGRLVTRLEIPTSGSIRVLGKPIHEYNRMEYHAMVQMIFQDPYESLNPRMTIFDIIAEPLHIHNVGTLEEREDKVMKLLAEVGLTPPDTFLWRYPHELSGGQRQRVAIARALVLNPKLIVADEPTSMLDVSVRTGVMQLMMQLQEEHHVSYLYITHDLAVARYMVNRIAVMYLGKIVELAETEELLGHPMHPYTRALMDAVPVPDPEYRRAEPNIIGNISVPIDPPTNCRFYDRCPYREVLGQKCKNEEHPPLAEVAPGHYVACYPVQEGKI